MSDLMRLSGINSGYDTEAMIEKMLQTYQSRIDTQNKKLTKLTWQQDAYRDIISKLTTFKNKYFDILKRDNYLLSPTAFKKFTANITNKTNPNKTGGISVTTTASSAVGTHTVKVTQTATATKLTGDVLRSQNFKLDLERAAKYSDYTVEEIENEDDGSITKTRNYNFALDVKVGDVTRTIEFDVSVDQDEDGNINMDDFSKAVQDALNEKFEKEFGFTGKDDTSGLHEDGKERFLSVKVGEDGKMNFVVGGNSTVIIAEKTGDFGMARPTDGVSIAAQACVTGTNSVSVTVNNVKKTITDDDGNESEIEVSVTKKVDFTGVSETYFDTRNEPGNEAILEQYNKLKLAAYKKDHWGLPPFTQEQLDNYSYSSTQAAKDLNAKSLEDALNKSFMEEGVAFTVSEDGLLVGSQEFSITTVSGGTLGITKASASNKISTNTSLKDLGIADKDEKVEFTINGKEISLESSASVNDLIKAVNNSGAGVTMTYSNLEGRFIITANDMGNGGDFEISANKFTAALGLADDENTPSSKVEVGQNAIFELDGVEIYHNSNSYTFDGNTINFSEAEAGSEYTIGISRSYDDIKNAIKDFVKDYNQLIDDIYDYIGTAPKRDNKNNLYEPLTDDEKAEMSDKEIEKWEEAAKQGILYNDSTVSSIMSQLRMVLYNSVETADGTKFGLYNMGITTMDYKTNAHGKLQIDEEAFDKAFEEHADDIMKLFTDTETGVMGKVNTILDNAVRTTSTNMGSLVRKAGLKDSNSAKNNEIYRQMEQINKRIATLQDRYNAKEDYWWNVFTNLEKMMANMNNQSSYLANYFGYTGNYQ